MSSSTRNKVIADITRALPLRSDERVIIDGTFAEFQAAAIALWAEAPVGEDSEPDSCRTEAVTLHTEAA